MPHLKLTDRKARLTSLLCSSLRNGKLTEGLQLFQQGLQESETMLHLEIPCFLCIFSAFCKHDKKHSSMEAKKMHVHVISNRLEKDLMVGTSLIHMYGKLNHTSYAYTIFDSMETKNVVTWNAMISLFAKTKESELAIQLFHQMVCEGILPVKVTFLAIVNATKDFDLGTRIHAIIVIRNEISLDVHLQTCLVSMYGRYGRSDMSREIFDLIEKPNIVSWTNMISVYAENKRTREAFEFLSRMQSEAKLVPNDVTFISLLGLCAEDGLLINGMHLHGLIVAFGFDLLIVVTNALLNFYNKCSVSMDAHQIFLAMSEKDLISWNTMISMNNTCNTKGIESYNYFKEMCHSGVNPSKATFKNILDACANVGSLHEGYKVHFCIMDAGLDQDQTIENSIINMYGRCQSLKDVQKMFNKTLKYDIVTWNIMFGAILHNGHGEDALFLYQQMILEGVVPNNLTFPMVFSVFANLKRFLPTGRRLHSSVVLNSEFSSDIAIQNSIMNMYGKCGDPLATLSAFLNMQEHNVVSWNVLMSAYAQHNCRKVLHLFKEMLCQGIFPDEMSLVSVLNACAHEEALSEGKRIHVYISDGRQSLHVWNALIDMYHKCNDLDKALQAFCEIISTPDCVTWNSILSALMQETLCFVLFNDMLQNGIMPNQLTFLALLSACASQAMLGIGKQIHTRIILESKLHMLDVAIHTNLVKMYGSCGELIHASRIFQETVNPNVVSYNSMLSTYAQYGNGEVTLTLLRNMLAERITPDEVTFTCILSALSHNGLMDETLNLFCIMQSSQGLECFEDHYNCLIDALGRAGQLDKAEQVLKDSPFLHELLPIMTLLGACKVHKDFDKGNKVMRANLFFDQIGVMAYAKLINNFNAIEIQDSELFI